MLPVGRTMSPTSSDKSSLADGRSDDRDSRGGGREGTGRWRGPGVDHIRLRGHELGGERRQPLQPVMSEAGLQRNGLPVNVTELGEPRSHAIHWRIDVVRCSW